MRTADQASGAPGCSSDGQTATLGKTSKYRVAPAGILLLAISSLAISFGLGFLGLLPVQVWSVFLELCGIGAVAVQIADIELTLLDGHRNWLSQVRCSWAALKRVPGRVSLSVLRTARRIDNWLHGRKHASIAMGGVIAGTATLSGNAEVTWAYERPLTPVQGTTVADAIADMNDRLNEISERFIRVAESVRMMDTQIRKQMEADQASMEALIGRERTGIVQLIDRLQIGGARIAKLGLWCLAIGAVIGMLAPEIVELAGKL